MTLLNRRLMTTAGVVMRVVAVNGDSLVVAKRGQPAQTVDRGLVEECVLQGALVDVTDGRPCPECGGRMERDGNCRIEWDEPATISGYYRRDGATERRVKHAPVWMCTACEHIEEER